MPEGPDGRCTLHGDRMRSDNGLMTGPCGACEAEAYFDMMVQDEIEAYERTGMWTWPIGPVPRFRPVHADVENDLPF